MLEILMIPMFGLMNALRGSGKVSKVMVYGVAAAVSVWTMFGLNIIPAVILFFGLWLGFAPGWGKYFMAYTGWDKRSEKEFIVADYILDAAEEHFGTMNNYLFGIIGMTIRFFVCFLPLYMGLAAVLGNYVGLFLDLVLFSVGAGLIYYLVGRLSENIKSVRLCEVLVGMLLGLTLIMGT